MPKKKTSKPRPQNAVGITEQLRGIVHLHPGVEMQTDPRHGYVLSWTNAPPPKGNWLSRLFSNPALRRRRIALDDMGRRTVELIDGRRKIREIADALAAEFGTDRDRARAATIVFIGQLMSKNIVKVVSGDRPAP